MMEGIGMRIGLVRWLPGVGGAVGGSAVAGLLGYPMVGGYVVGVVAAAVAQWVMLHVR